MFIRISAESTNNNYYRGNNKIESSCLGMEITKEPYSCLGIEDKYWVSYASPPVQKTTSPW